MSITSLPSILSTTTATGSGGSATSSDNVSAQKDEFLKLLVAQLAHQDPLNPQDSSAFVSQLAQFSALEQSAKTNDQLAALSSAMSSQNRAGMAALVGKTVIARASSVTVGANGTAPPCTVHLDGSAKSVEVDLVDGSGKTVRTTTLGTTPSGDVPITWPAGGALPAGQYSIQIKATGADGSTVNASAELKGVIQSLGFANGGTTFTVNGVDIAPSDIVSIQN